MNSRTASGLQVTLLVFAVVLLAAPISTIVTGLWWWTDAQRGFINRSAALLLGAAVLLAFPGLRRACRAALAMPVARHRQGEVGMVTAAQLVVGSPGTELEFAL